MKHGVSLALVEVLFAGKCTLLADDRLDYGEVRTLASGMIGVRLFVCVYTDRGDVRRLISLRRAHQREDTRYAKELE